MCNYGAWDIKDFVYKTFFFKKKKKIMHYLLHEAKVNAWKRVITSPSYLDS